MATLKDIGLSAAINILSAFVFLVAFAILRLQPFNDRVYFPKWYLKGLRYSPRHAGAAVRKFVNLDYRSYVRFLNWMPAAMKMPEPELIDHAGLDSAVYLRIYLLGLKIFVPIALLTFVVLVPVNWTNKTLELLFRANPKLTYSDIDKLSISNIPLGSQRFWAHLMMAYAITFWTCYVLYKEYELIATMRLHFLASEQRRPDQFTEIDVKVKKMHTFTQSPHEVVFTTQKREDSRQYCFDGDAVHLYRSWNFEMRLKAKLSSHV
ncbi:Csc1-like protein [Thalictrum thalictroides]|uniref:Csc1-like protein n=1 Tax=Thalictrum thalictroides TaxID=46969 RepID=A0A7J6WI34_THATH|nr:Csc1-like protein [Thalictrum thalictroides]